MNKDNVIDLAAYRKELKRSSKASNKQSGIPISPELKAAIEVLIDRLRSSTPDGDSEQNEESLFTRK